MAFSLHCSRWGQAFPMHSSDAPISFLHILRAKELTPWQLSPLSPCPMQHTYQPGKISRNPYTHQNPSLYVPNQQITHTPGALGWITFGRRKYEIIVQGMGPFKKKISLFLRMMFFSGTLPLHDNSRAFKNTSATSLQVSSFLTLSASPGQLLWL